MGQQHLAKIKRQGRRATQYPQGSTSKHVTFNEVPDFDIPAEAGGAQDTNAWARWSAPTCSAAIDPPL
eukprot:222240-Pyramimonas_sp.AAC.1